MKAENLHIRLVERSKTRVELTFCASLTEHLPRLLPKAVREKLRDGSTIDLAAIAQAAEATDYAPGELFCFAEGSHVLRAWLD